MDRSIYVAMTGAAQILRAQDAVSNNLANASTVGFKSELSAFQPVPVLGPGEASRINTVAQGIGEKMTEGAMISTGRTLDVAVQGQGWIAVQAPDGSEAYTRAGNLQLTADGQLTDAQGDPVIGNSGPISLPDSQQISIGSDGTISTVPLGQGPNTLATLDRIKLVDPAPSQLTLGADGLMHMSNGGTAQPSDQVTLVSGQLEGSNVDPSSELVRMIALSRQYDMQMQSIKNAENDADSANKLLQAN